VTGVVTRILGITTDSVLVGTSRSPSGQAVPLAWIQQGLDLLERDGVVEVHPDALEHRSAFVGEVLLTLPGTAVEGSAPPQIVLARPAGTWDLAPGDEIRRTELHDKYGGSRQEARSRRGRLQTSFSFWIETSAADTATTTGGSVTTSTTQVTGRRATRSFEQETPLFSATRKMRMRFASFGAREVSCSTSVVKA
jgi:hypothetical protein